MKPDDYCYSYEWDEKEKYDKAEEFCNENSGTLVVPLSKPHTDFLVRYIGENTWIGVHNPDGKNKNWVLRYMIS